MSDSERKQSERLRGHKPTYDFESDKDLDYQAGATALDRAIKQSRIHVRSKRQTDTSLEDTIIMPSGTPGAPGVVGGSGGTTGGGTGGGHPGGSAVTGASAGSGSAPSTTATAPSGPSTGAPAGAASASTGGASGGGTAGGGRSGGGGHTGVSSTGGVSTSGAPVSTGSGPTTTVVMSPMLPSLHAYNGNESPGYFMKRFQALAHVTVTGMRTLASLISQCI